MVINYSIKKTITYVDGVQRASNRAAKRVLTRYGAFVRRDVKKLIRRKGTKKQPTSKPGQPPFSPTGNLLRSVLFHYDDRDQSVVIGPEFLNKTRVSGVPTGGDTVPKVLEESGHIRIVELLVRMRTEIRGRNAQGRFATVKGGYEEKWIQANRIRKEKHAKFRQRVNTVAIEARPYMSVAYDKNQSKLMEWRNQIR